MIHTHTTAGMGVACKKEGLRYDNFYSAQLHGLLAFHDFEGITTDVNEQGRLVKSLGDKPVMILRNHGLLVVGPHLPHALSQYWTVQRACEVQLAADSLAGENQPVGKEVLEAIPAQAAFFRAGKGGGPTPRPVVLRRADAPREAALRRSRLARRQNPIWPSRLARCG